MKCLIKLYLIFLFILLGTKQPRAANFEGYFPHDVHSIYIESNLKWFVTSTSLQCYDENKGTLQIYPYPEELCTFRGGMLYPRVAYKDGNLWIQNSKITEKQKEWDICFSLLKRTWIDMQLFPQPQWTDMLRPIMHFKSEANREEYSRRFDTAHSEMSKIITSYNFLEAEERLGGCILDKDSLWCGTTTFGHRLKYTSKWFQYNINSGHVKIVPFKTSVFDSPETSLFNLHNRPPNDLVPLQVRNKKILALFYYYMHDASYTNLCEFDPNTEEWEPILKESVTSVAFEGDVIWFGTREGVFRMAEKMGWITYNGKLFKEKE